MKAARGSASLKSILKNKMRLGSEGMRELGNLYTAALAGLARSRLRGGPDERART